jgi:hypothetical protein
MAKIWISFFLLFGAFFRYLQRIKYLLKEAERYDRNKNLTIKIAVIMALLTLVESAFLSFLPLGGAEYGVFLWNDILVARFSTHSE